MTTEFASFTSAASDQSPESLSFIFSGKLLLREEIPLTDTDFAQKLDEGLFREISPYIVRFFKKQCRRCGNLEKALLGTLPCALCGHDHLYCRKCIDMGRVMACEMLYIWSGPAPQWPMHQDPCTWQGELTPAQQIAAASIIESIKTQEREKLIWAVCGAGKTEMIFSGITEALKQGKRICLATPRADVVRELKPRLKHAFQQVSIEALFGGSPDRAGSAQFIIATTHQLIRFQDAFDLMIIDEIDAFPYHTDTSLPFMARRSAKQTGTIIYLTATPRIQHKQLIHEHKLPHVFVPTRYHGYPLPVPSMKMNVSLQKDLQNYRIPKALMSWLHHRKNPERQLLIFVPHVALAEALNHHWPALFLQEKIIGSMREFTAVHANDAERAQKIALFRQRELRVIITTTILERGVTFLSVDVAVLDAGHHVFDEAALVQIAGRAGRSSDDPRGEVMFFHDGKTEAMTEAIKQIHMMNDLGVMENDLLMV